MSSSENESKDKDEADGTAGQSRPVGPLVFISHDTRDADLAEALSKLLASVSAGMLKAFRSSDRKGNQGIDFGAEWYPELMKQLDSACDVVCLLTEQSLGRPWLLYEAGVAKGKLDVPVHGLALGVPLAKANTGPFAQFQNCNNDTDSITKLVVQLVQRLPSADPDEDTVRAQVDVFRGRVEHILARQAATTDDDVLEHDDASTAKLFEEIKVMFQDLPSRIDGAAERARERRPRIHPPGMIHEMALAVGRGEPTLGMVALIVSSYFREDLPWFYEMGVELYRLSLGGRSAAVQRAYRNFLQAAEIATVGPWSRGIRSKEAMILLDELPLLMRDLPVPPGPRSVAKER